MKRIFLTAAVLTAMAGGGFALAQAPGATPKTAATPAPGRPGWGGPGMMGGGNGCGMMGGNGMMGGGMMGGAMGMMGGPNTKVDVKKVDKGVTITLTSSDAPTVARLQKMAEAMKLMHEAMTQ